MDAPIGTHEFERFGALHRIILEAFACLAQVFGRARRRGMSLADRILIDVLEKVRNRTAQYHPGAFVDKQPRQGGRAGPPSDRGERARGARVCVERAQSQLPADQSQTQRTSVLEQAALSWNLAACSEFLIGRIISAENRDPLFRTTL